MCQLNKLIVFVCCAYLAGCSPRAQSFDYNKHVNKTFFSAVGSIDRQENFLIASVHVYSARFIEVLDEKDGLLEYKLYNEASSAIKRPLKEIIGNSQQLFFFRL